MVIGILALEGTFQEHLRCLQLCGVNGKLIKNAHELADINGLIFPSGDIYKMIKKIQISNLFYPLLFKIQEDIPIWGTCSGMVLLAKKIEDMKIKNFKLMDINITKNHIFDKELKNIFINIPALGINNLEITLNNNYNITSVKPNVGILSKISDNEILMVRQGDYLACSFMPELLSDLRIHKYFINMVKNYWDLKNKC